MNCSDYLELISGHIDGVNTAEEEALLHAHLAECPDCWNLLAAYEQIDDNTSELSVTAPAGLKDSIMREISKAPAKKKTSRAWTGVLVSAGMVAAAAGIVFGVGAIRGPDKSDFRSVRETAAVSRKAEPVEAAAERSLFFDGRNEAAGDGGTEAAEVREDAPGSLGENSPADEMEAAEIAGENALPEYAEGQRYNGADTEASPGSEDAFALPGLSEPPAEAPGCAEEEEPAADVPGQVPEVGTSAKGTRGKSRALPEFAELCGIWELVSEEENVPVLVFDGNSEELTAVLRSLNGPRAGGEEEKDRLVFSEGENGEQILETDCETLSLLLETLWDFAKNESKTMDISLRRQMQSFLEQNGLDGSTFGGFLETYFAGDRDALFGADGFPALDGSSRSSTFLADWLEMKNWVYFPPALPEDADGPVLPEPGSPAYLVIAGEPEEN